MTNKVMIAPMGADHWPVVERIYAAGIATGHATFESEPPTWQRFDATKLPDHRHLSWADPDTSAGPRPDCRATE